MPSTNVETFAAELKVPPEVLLEQLRAAGVKKGSATDSLSEADKERLLTALRNAHGGSDAPKKKISVVRKQTSEIKQADATGKARTIQVEVRKRRTFVKRDAAEPQVPEQPPVEATPAPAPAPTISSNAVIDEEQRKLRAEEERRNQELLERQARELREKTERLEREKAREVEAAAEAARREQAAREEAERVAKARAEGDARAEREAQAAAEIASKAAADAAEAARVAQRDAEAMAESRRRAEEEVAAINRLLTASRQPPPPPPAPPPPAPAAAAAPGPAGAGGAAARRTGTLHRTAAAPGAAPAAGADARKHVKSEKLSSTWQEEAAKRRQLKTRGDGGANTGWRGARGPRRGGDRHGGDRHGGGYQQQVEAVVRDVHVPETITVTELAHKMAVKAAEVIKRLMKLGQMVTINQVLDQETAMILVEEMATRPRRPSWTIPKPCSRTSRVRLPMRPCCRVRRLSPSWATSTTARPRCSTTSAAPRLRLARPAVSPSILAPITSKRHAAL